MQRQRSHGHEANHHEAAGEVASAGHVLREVARDVIPPEVRNRVKKPLMAPSFTSRAEDPLNCLVSDIISSNSMQSVPFFNNKTLREIRDDPILLMAASLCIIQDRYHVT